MEGAEGFSGFCWQRMAGAWQGLARSICEKFGSIQDTLQLRLFGIGLVMGVG